MRVTAIRNRGFQGMSGLKRALLDIVAESYADPDVIVDWAWQRTDTVYLAETPDQRVVSFFFAAWQELEIADRGRLQTVYMGLSGTSAATRNMGLVARLYETLVREAADWERAHRQPLIYWFTTANPIAYGAASRLFSTVTPSLEGSYTHESKSVAAAIRKFRGYPAGGQHDHPFVLHGVADGGARYSAEEAEFIAAMARSRKFDLLEELKIVEAHGDRLLVICEGPKVATEAT